MNKIKVSNDISFQKRAFLLTEVFKKLPSGTSQHRSYLLAFCSLFIHSAWPSELMAGSMDITRTDLSSNMFKCLCNPICPIHRFSCILSLAVLWNNSVHTCRQNRGVKWWHAQSHKYLFAGAASQVLHSLAPHLPITLPLQRNESISASVPPCKNASSKDV